MNLTVPSSCLSAASSPPVIKLECFDGSSVQLLYSLRSSSASQTRLGFSPRGFTWVPCLFLLRNSCLWGPAIQRKGQAIKWTAMERPQPRASIVMATFGSGSFLGIRFGRGPGPHVKAPRIRLPPSMFSRRPEEPTASFGASNSVDSICWSMTSPGENDRGRSDNVRDRIARDTNENKQIVKRRGTLGFSVLPSEKKMQIS